VFFSCDKVEQTESDENQQNNVGALIPLKLWDTAFSKVTWAVKWTANGLGPIRPCVSLLKELVLPPGHCLVLQ
jgi:hypothetical protein